MANRLGKRGSQGIFFLVGTRSNFDHPFRYALKKHLLLSLAFQIVSIHINL